MRSTRPARLVLLYAAADWPFAEELERRLQVLRYSISLWSPSPRHNRPSVDVRRTVELEITSADIILPLLSSNFFHPNEFLFDPEWLMQLALSQIDGRETWLIAVLIKHFGMSRELRQLLGPPQKQILIDVRAHRQTQLDEALFRIVDAVRYTLEGAGFTGNAWLGYAALALNRLDCLPIHQIFRTDGPPEQTFVAPVQFKEIKDELGVMGRGLIVEGPSKVGKSTAVRAALAQEASGKEVRSFDGKFMSADDRDPDIVADFELFLARIVAGTFSGHLIIDDFHYVEESLKKKLAKRMKALADQAQPSAKVTIIGINPIGYSLPQLVPDLAGRFRIVRMNRQPDAKLAELIIRGEQAAGVRFRRRDEIINEADGSFYIAQLLCQRLLGKAGIATAQRNVTDVDFGPPDVLEGIRDDLYGRYHDQIRDFAAHDAAPPPRGAGIALLWLLSRSKNGDVAIQEAIFRYPALAPAFEWLRASNLQTFFQTHAGAKELLYYNRPAGTVSIEDPQLKFFLRKLDWEALASASGHVNVQFHAVDGPLFSSTIHAPTSGNPPVSATPGHAISPAASSEGQALVLHLSDLHIATTAQSTVWYAQLAADLRQQRCDKLSALVVSGDIANLSTPAEYKAARMFLEQVMTGFGLAPRQLVLVPGNHDLNWALAQDAYALHKRARYSGPLVPGSYIDHGPDIVEVRDDSAYKLRFKHFAELYREMKGEDYPLEYEEQGTIHRLPEHGLLFLGLNTAWEIDHHFRDRASVNPNALARSLLSLGPPAELRIAVFHHPVQSDSEDRIKDAGFLQQLAVAGFRLALHGHIHKSVNQLYRYDMSPGGRRIDLVASGTFGAPTRELVPGYPLQYNLLRVTAERVIVETRRREEVNGAWAPDARWLRGDEDPEPRYEIDLANGKVRSP